MNTDEEFNGFLDYAKQCIQNGYDKAHAFCVYEGITPLVFLRAVTHSSPGLTMEQKLIDFGAMKWCMEQLT